MIKNSSKKFKELIKRKTVLVGEIGQAHEGSLNIAHSFIDVCADLGLDVVKFQTHYAEQESTMNEPFRIKFSFKDKKRFNYWKRMEFSPREWQGLYAHARSRGLMFMSSVFSQKAFRIINSLDVCAWKVASGEVSNLNLISDIIKTKKTIILSTGLSNYKEINNVVAYLKKKKANFVLLQCTSSYPTKLEEIGCNVVEQFKKKYKCLVGMSDHSGTIFPSIYGICNNYNLLEFHITFDKKMFGPDSSSSLDLNQVKELMKIKKNIEILKNNPVNKNTIFKKIKNTKKIFTKSICLKEPQKKGYIIKSKDLILKKPGNGISPQNLSKILGKKLKKNKSNLELLKFSDLI